MPTTTDRDAESWGPTVRGRSRRRIRPLRVLLLALVIGLVVLLVFGWWANSRIPRVPVDGLASGGSPLHVLVVGSDSRADLSPEERRELTTGSAEGERTDTIFLMTIRGSDVALLAFPRDLWVERCDGSTGRINVAQQLGGPSCLVQTVRDLSGIPIAHYVSVGFGGFRDIVDAVGGVEICLQEPIADRDAGIDLPEGCQTLQGNDALGFVRVRKIDDDLMRIQRQQTFLRSLASEIASPTTLLNPTRIVPLVDGVGGALVADEGLGPIGLARVAWGLRGLAGGTAVTETVPSTRGFAGEADVQYLDEAAAIPLFSAFRDGSILDGERAQRDRSEVTVRVLNGAGVPGLAGRVAEILEGRGYVVGEVGNADARDRTVIQHPPDARADAELVASDIPQEVALEETSEVTAVTVVLGRDAGSIG